MLAKFMSLLWVCCISAMVFAQDAPGSIQNNGSNGTDSSNSTVVNQANGTKTTIQTFYCPAPSELNKNGLFWGTAAGDWKSYSESFDNKVTGFVGAQWVGINVGKMVCIYKGNISMSFPITLQNDTLAQAPTGGLWGKDLGGYRNCHSVNMADCPFIVKTQSANIQQIYDSLNFFKGKTYPLNNDNNQ